MAGLTPHETFRITVEVPSAPVRESSRALNIPGVDDNDMDIDRDIHQVVTINTVTEAERARIGAEAVQVASNELLVNIRTKFDRSGFLTMDTTSAKELPA